MNKSGGIGCGAALVAFCLITGPAAMAQCGAPPNPIVAENCLTGNPSAEWSIGGAGDPSIQGFATDISVNVGQTINFKVSTNATSYRLDIYRMGYYGGLGARKITTLSPSVQLPQAQPACLTDATTFLVDCGNWGVSASWPVPANVVSGIYFVHLVRADTGGDSHIFFVVRNDSSHSDLLYGTNDESWHAYNPYGGHSLYGDTSFNIPNRALKVSYNRPFNTAIFESATWIFGAEYPMVRWLEANGYDISYFTGVDAARSGNLIKNHKVFVDAGHDEYWSGPRRANIEAARDAGVNLAFFSGNEGFWKTRWENSIDGSGTPYRTLVCYKETIAGAKIDPASAWTGTWRDPRFSPPSDGGRPENALTGTSFQVNGPGADNTGLSILVPAADGQMRFWRNTPAASQAPGHTAALPSGTLGYEWDVDADNGFRPAGLFDLSTSIYNMTTDLLLDYGATYGGGPATHHLTLYRAPSGALVFGAGTVQWSWGLDDNHSAEFSVAPAPDLGMQQATVNLIADMGVQPASLQPGLLPASKSTDTTPPTSTITTPATGSVVTGGTSVIVSGTANDFGGGTVGGVEVSTDGGVTWHPASGRGSWTYSWTPKFVGTVTVESRAVDDSGNLELPVGGHSVTVSAATCPCGNWSSSTTPKAIDSGDGSPIEVGLRFQADYSGYITALRYYKSAANTGTHSGHLWSSTGTLLASAQFRNETSSGWQQVNFSSPVPVSAGTVYTASYFAPAGHYSADVNYFSASTVDSPPLHSAPGPNGVYSYGGGATFPASSYIASNYWVDVVYIPAGPMAGAAPSMLISQTSLGFSAYIGQAAPAAQNVNIYNQGSGTLNWSATSNAAWLVLSPTSGTMPSTLSISVNPSGLAAGIYNATIAVNASGGSNPSQTIAVSLTLYNTLLTSNFGGTALDGWAVSPLGLAGNWSVVNSALQYNGGGHTQLYSGNTAWTDYNVQAAIKLSTLSDYPGGIRGRVNTASGAAYTAWLYPAEGLVKLYKNVSWNINSGFTLLGQAAVTFDTAAYHTLGLSFQGSQIQVVYDGAPIVAATDTSYTSGLIALDVSSQAVTFNSVTVSALSAPSASLTATPSTLSFQSTNPAAQTVQLATTGTGTLAWTAASTATWLTVSPTNGVTPSALAVSASLAGLTPGTYNGNIAFTSLAAPNSPLVIAVTLTIPPPPPVLGISPAGFTFLATQNQTSPATQPLSVSNTAGWGSFSWTAASDSTWLGVSPASGSTPGSASISVNPAGLPLGTLTGNVTVAASGVANSPRSVPVQVTVLAQEMAETFADLGVGWQISPMGLANAWSAANSSYSFNGSGLSQSCSGSAAWTDYTFDTNIRLSNLSNWPGGVRGRVDPVSGAGYAVWLYPGSGLAILYRVPQWSINGPGVTVLAQAPLSFDAAYHDLQMLFLGSQITVNWDGVALMSAPDAAFTSGYVCMDADSQPITYQNVRVAAVQSPITLTGAPAAVAFVSLGGVTPAAQNFAVATGAAATTTWGVATSSSWLGATLSSIAAPGSLNIAVSPAGLAAGSYSGTVTLYTPGATNSAIAVPVTLAVKTAALAVSPTTLTFTGAPNAAIAVTNSGTGSLVWTATADSAWIGLSAAGGNAPSSITVTPNPAGLAPGTYAGKVSVASNDVANGPIVVNVSFTINPPAIALAPATLTFMASQGQGMSQPQSVLVTNAGGYGTFSWTASSDSAWLNVAPASGIAPSNLAITVNPASLATGHYTGNVIVSGPGIPNSPQSIPVSMNVFAAAMTETFASAAGWNISPMGSAGGWSLAGSTYNYTGGLLSQSCAGNTGWTDYTFDTNIKLSTLNNWPGGVRGRVNPVTGAGYALWLYPGSGLAILYAVAQWDVNGPSLIALAQAPLSYDNTAFHDLQMVFIGNRITVNWDGVFLLGATDTTYAGGYVCMDADSQAVSYQNVRVAATQSAIAVSGVPASVTFGSQPGASPSPQTFALTTGGAASTWGVTSSATWLTATLSSSLSPGTLTLSANPAGMAEGTYSATVKLFAPGATNSPVVIPVTLAVMTAALAVNPPSLAFFGSTTSNPAIRTISINNAGTGSLAWTASADQAWILLGANSGTAPASLTVGAAAGTLAAGTYTGNITISSADVGNGPVVIPVSLQVGTSTFSDDFSAGAGNWTISPLGNAAGWSVAAGAYAYNGQGATQSWAGSAAWSNYTAALDFKLASLNDYPGGFRGRVDTTVGSGYGAWIYPAEGIVKLYRIGQWQIDNGFSLLGQSGSLAFDSVNYHHLRLVFQGSQIQVYYDDVLAIQATDATYTQGAVALDVSNQPIAFKNVSVIGP